MSTLQQIGFTVAGGSVVFATCFLFFGIAVYKRHIFIAPRATARPRDVIYSPNRTIPIPPLPDNNNDDGIDDTTPKKKNKNKPNESITSIPNIQYRGNPIWGWIPWTLSLNYDTMLRGVPGTGTRSNGLQGVMLSVTLDGIVLLRFHAFAMRVSAVATILYIVCLTPMYVTARCFWQSNSSTQQLSPECTSNQTVNNYYEQMTIVNIPSNSMTVSSSSYEPTYMDRDSVVARLYFIVFLFWVVMCYTFRELHQEWIHILAMRRVYYLEYDIHGVRKRELERLRLMNTDTAPNKQKETRQQQFLSQQRLQSTTTPKRKRAIIQQEEPHLIHRETFIPHPELAEVIPNVSLYSVLVGGLPSLPKQAPDALQKQDGAAGDIHRILSKRERVDWQLGLTAAFFDNCVPNQPGFSSSVAAVTIIPGAKSMANAWKKWSKAASSLRRLRFLHQQITLRKQQQLQQIQQCGSTKKDNIIIDHENDEILVPEEIADNFNFNTLAPQPELVGPHVKNSFEYSTEAVKHCSTTSMLFDIEKGIGKSYDEVSNTDERGSPLQVISRSSERMSTSASPSDGVEESISPASNISKSSRNQVKSPQHVICTPKSVMQSYCAQVLGSFDDDDNSITNVKSNKQNDIVDEMNVNQLEEESAVFGPEQSAVYSREFAQAASGCSPNGFCYERKITTLSLEKLIQMKEQAEIDTLKAYEELKNARDKAAIFSDYLNKNSEQDDEGDEEQNQGNGEHPSQHNNMQNSIMNYGMTTIEEHDGLLSEHTRSNVSSPINSMTVMSGSFDDLPLDRPLSQQTVTSTNTKTASATTYSSAGVGSNKSKIRKKPAIGDFRIPSDMKLEADLLRKRTWETNASQGKGTFVKTSPYKLQSSRSFTKVATSTNPTRPQLGRNKTTGSTPTDIRASGKSIINQPEQTDKIRASGRNQLQRAANELGIEEMIEFDLEANQTQEKTTTEKVSRTNAKHPSGLSAQSSGKGESKVGNNISLLNDTSRRHLPEEAPTDDSNYQDNPKVDDCIPFSMALQSERETNTENDIGEGSRHGIFRRHFSEHRSPWSKVESIVDEALDRKKSQARSRSITSSTISTGVWEMPNIRACFRGSFHQLRKWALEKADKAAEDLARDSTYAVVTFTSRQAAIAARACIADGRGHRRWLTLHDIPIPPLADAPAWDFGFTVCRNCCRPVTISINQQQKTLRNYFCILLLGFIYVFYTVPLTLAAQFVAPDSLSNLFPNIDQIKLFDSVSVMSGLLTAGVWSAFFAVCPVMFRAIANFGSKATSVAHAEFSALQYYWWFMVITAFSGQTLANMGIKGLTEGIDVASNVGSVLMAIAQTIPTVTAVTWLNWIIVRLLIILPLNYLLQINTFIYHFLGMPCLARVMVGGGPGGPIPYRIYIDSGMVFLCLQALAPVSPLVAPACFCYFLFCQPLLRRNCIFVYRPSFDGGGHRWPFLFTVCISAMVTAEILLTAQMALKQVTGPTVLAGLSIIPTLMFQNEMRNRYLRSFEDAALCQTSMLDGWYDEGSFTFERREEFRKFLVDAHKAAYVPVCLASPMTDDFLTAEPAVVIPKEGEEMQSGSILPTESLHESVLNSLPNDLTASGGNKKPQLGATFRRSANVMKSFANRSQRAMSEACLQNYPQLYSPIAGLGNDNLSTKSE